ncbi:MAG: nucleoside triphosphate pyrophosphohydrolase family protein [bacterium]|nr:nucleoside triphosphate pyrophosphohydrolase family protein [bacterium]
MTFDEYQIAAIKTANLKRKNELFHLVLGLVGEAGEVAEKFKKLVRDKNTDETQIDRQDMQKELGDVLWYVAVLSKYLGLDLENVASANVEKLASRQQRGKLSGSGDNR